MSMHKLNKARFKAFSDETNARPLGTLHPTKPVQVILTDRGTVVVVEEDDGVVTVIGDSVGVYWGKDAPEYLA